MEDDIVIDNHNFKEYFFDVRKHGPKEGQVMVKFTAVAVLGDGTEKKDLIKVLKMDKANAGAMIMKKIHCAREPDCYRVCREICEDLDSGMSDGDVSLKEYEFVIEAFYYTKREYIPKDPHWETIDLIEFDPETNTFKSNIEI